MRRANGCENSNTGPRVRMTMRRRMTVGITVQGKRNSGAGLREGRTVMGIIAQGRREARSKRGEHGAGRRECAVGRQE